MRRRLVCCAATRGCTLATRASRAPLRTGRRPLTFIQPRRAADTFDLAAFAAGKKLVLVGLPGAFTPGCSATHLPGYVKAAEAIKAKGVSDVLVVSVNDPFVMEAWGKAHGADGKVRMIADATGALTKALGVAIDLTGNPAIGGVRSKRYSAIVQDGKVTALNLEPEDKPTGLTCSLADPLLKML